MKNLILILSVLLSSSAFAQGPPTIIYGTAGNDVLLFQGNLQQLTTAITNAYSGEVVFIDDVYNRSSYAYDGLAGTDTMALTNFKDAAFLQNTNGYQMFYNIERFIFSDGDDIAELASTNFVLGNVFMDGGRGNDILWGNWGNDTLRGGDGNDNIDGGPGNDVLNGQNGDDIISGGDGNDTITPGLGVDAILGNDGNDTFFFTADGTNANGLNISLDTFDGGPGFDTIYLTTGSDYLSLRVTNGNQVIFDIEEFYLGSGNDILDLSDASIVLSNLTIYGEAGNDLIIANAGDDYIDAGNGNDVVQGGMGNDYILGGDGNDILDGDPGNDTIFGAAGGDQAWGGDGDDTFFTSLPESAVDELDGGDGADTISLQNILTGFDPETSDLDLFLRIVPLTAGEFEFEVRVNTDGDLGGAFWPIARIRFIEFLDLGDNGPSIVIPRTPEIVVEQPVSTNIANGGTNSFGTVAAGSTTNLTFTIRNLGPGALNLTGTPKVQMSGTNAADFTVTLQPMTPVAYSNTTAFEVSFAPSATGLRTALITIANNDTNENPFEITLTGTGVSIAPSITSQPQNRTNVVGTLADFAVTASGTAPLHYQWWKDAAPLSGETNDTYTIASVSTNDASDYFVVVTNVAGSITSQVAVLTVVAPPEITSQPQSATNFVGTMVLLSVTADGTEPLRYQWWKDAAPLSDETNNSFSITSADLTNSGDYVVVVTNDYGSVTSEVATLTVVVSNSPGIDIVWVTPSSGNWHEPTNWSPNVVPRPQDTAIISVGTVYIDVNGAGSVSNLMATNAILQGTGVLTVGGDMYCPNVSIHGKLVIAPSGTLHLDSGTWFYMNGASLTNYGTVVWGSSPISAVGSSLVYNAGLWRAGSDQNLWDSTGTNRFINAGTFEKTGGAGYSAIACDFTTTGVIDTTTGGLYLQNWTGSNVLSGLLNWKGGNLNGTLTLASNAVLNWQDGTVNTRLVVENDATVNWTGGILAGQMEVLPDQTLNLFNATVTLSGGVLTNYGTVVVSNSGVSGFNANIYNGGLWELRANDTLYHSFGTNWFLNAGTLRKSAASGVSTFNWNFTTTGVVDTQTGMLSLLNWTGSNVLSGVLNWNGGTLNGTLTLASNAVLDWQNGTVNTRLVVENDATVNWTGGTLAGQLDVMPDQTLNLFDATVTLSGGVLTNYGTVMVSNSSISGFSANIYNAGLWELRANDTLYHSFGTNWFSNVGTLQKSAGSGVSTFNWNFTTTGLSEVRFGTLSFGAICSQTAGETILLGGNLQVTQPFQLLGGVLAGTNSVTGNVVNDGGTVSPGASPGKLTILGSYTQTSNGVLQIELSGYSPGESFDQLEVTSTAILAGTLNVSLTNSFNPTNNSLFAVVTASELAGTFSSFNYPSNTFGMQAGYSGISAFVQVTNVASVVPSVVSGPFLDSGDIVVRFSGLAGETYTIESTDSLSPPNWQKATNLIAPTTDMGLGIGVFEFRETLLPTGQRYYRATHPAY